MPCPPRSVSEVARMPPLARVPQAPRSLMGLANLRGSVLPVASVRALLGREDVASNQYFPSYRPRGRIARRVGGGRSRKPGSCCTREGQGRRKPTSRPKPANICEACSTAVPMSPRYSIFRNCCAGASRRPHQSGNRSPPLMARETVQHAAVEMIRQRLVTFEVAGQEYALPLEAVREIVTAPENLTFVPGSDDAVRGVMPYRDGLLPLLSLRRLLGLPSAVLSREKVLIVAIGDVLIGFVADRTRAVLSVDPSRVEPAPAVLAARAGGEAQIKEIYRAGHGRLVSILAPERLFREDVMQKLMQGDATMKAKADDIRDESDAKELRFLVFRLDDNEFALPIDAVEEVARVPDQITRLPKTPKFLEGVVNLRGEVLPVVDQRRRFDMTATTVSANRRLVVVRTEQHRAGLIVDSVSEVLRCSPDRIKPSPDLTGDALGIVHSVINLESGRIVLLLDPSELLTRTERGLLDSFSKETRSKEIRQTKP